jgi:hypothetical protein
MSSIWMQVLSHRMRHGEDGCDDIQEPCGLDHIDNLGFRKPICIEKPIHLGRCYIVWADVSGPECCNSVAVAKASRCVVGRNSRVSGCHSIEEPRAVEVKARENDSIGEFWIQQAQHVALSRTEAMSNVDDGSRFVEGMTNAREGALSKHRVEVVQC